MPHVAHLIVGHSFIKARILPSEQSAQDGSTPLEKKFLIARSGHKDAVQFLKSHFGEWQFTVELIFAPSYLKIFQPAIEHVAYFGAIETFERPLLCAPHEPLVAEHLCFPANVDDAVDDIAAKLELNKIREVVVDASLGRAPWIQGVREKGIAVNIAGPTLADERASLLNAHLHREWQELLEGLPLAEPARPLAACENYFSIQAISAGVILDVEDNLVFQHDLPLPLLLTRWGQVRWNGPWYYRLRAQWTSIIETDANQYYVTQDREMGFWPGPAVYGRSLQLTLWDLLRVTDRFAGDADAGVESPQAMGKVVQLLDTLGRGLSAKTTLEAIEHQLQTEIRTVCALAQIAGSPRVGDMAEVIKE